MHNKNYSDMNAKEFFNLVMRMREAQKEYFKTHSSLDLRQAKTLEKEIDAEIERVNALAPRKDAQTDMFGNTF